MSWTLTRAELGQTDDHLMLIPGSVTTVQSNATRFGNERASMEEILDGIKRIRTPSWGGVPGWLFENNLNLQVERWQEYVKVLDIAEQALTSYADDLSQAQVEAREALQLWNEGVGESEEAIQAYNASVAAYNTFISSTACQAPGAPPAMGPAHPGQFVDPGEAKRREAQEMLAQARADLAAAARTATVKLGNTPGGRTEGGVDVGSGSTEWSGPSIDWELWDSKFGDPKHGSSGYETGAPESSWKIDLATFEAEGSVVNINGSYENYHGSVKVNADGSIQLIQGSAKASFGIDGNGLQASANAQFNLLRAEGSVGAEWGIVEAGASGYAQVGAEASGNLHVGPTGVHANGELFAGARAGAEATVDVGGVGAKGGAEAWAGVGASGHVDLGYSDGKFTIGGSGGLALGVGGKVELNLTVDVGKVTDTVSSAADTVGGWVSSGAEKLKIW
ncbi:putative T7SS-secreted protein [Nocardioides limicola]|uniref:putative T7SS-secreted protein n=1 Tax=Nocardioides limicola TaxID=2803368 RepID=UPI00193B0F25|nr:hypothetical protein [Nocardioides sp. DJM-14]